MFIYIAGAALGGICAGLWYHLHHRLFPDPEEHHEDHHVHEHHNKVVESINKDHDDDHH